MVFLIDESLITFLKCLPVIAGNKDGSVDAVLGGEIGILIDPDNVDGISSAIIKILKGDVEKRLLDAAYLRQRVIEEFGFEKFMKRLKETIEKITWGIWLKKL